MATEKLLVACVGGLQGVGADAKSCGLMMPGYCVPLAATPEAREQIEAIGEEDFSDWLGDADVEPPPSGGLWVLEFDLVEAQGEDEWAREPFDGVWRLPTDGELRGLLDAQTARCEKHGMTPGAVPAIDLRVRVEPSAWVVASALV